jgi:hypothetical protein
MTSKLVCRPAATLDANDYHAREDRDIVYSWQRGADTLVGAVPISFTSQD